MSKNKDFITFVECLSGAYCCYCLNQFMHKELNNGDKRYRRYVEYWNLSLRSTQFQYLVSLAKIFGRPDEMSVTVYHFLDYKFEKYERLLADLKKLRDKYLVHLDIKATRNLEDFLKKLDVKRDKFKPLFNLLIQETVRLARHYKVQGDLRKSFQMGAVRVRKEFADLYKILPKE